MKEEKAPLCACGCGQQVTKHRDNKGWNKYLQGHRHKIDRSPVGEAPECACGCGKKTTWRKDKLSWNKCLQGHHRVGMRKLDEQRKKEQEEKIRKRIEEYGEPPRCKCGCEELCGWWVQGKKYYDYKTGHFSRGKKLSKSHFDKLQNGRRKYICTPEHKKKISIANSGKSHPMYGKSHTGETKKKLSEANVGRKHTEATKRKLSELARGEKSGRWKGGITKLYNLIRSNSLNINWRKQVFERDNFTCQKCEKRGGNLNAHHIDHFKDILERDNISTLDEAINCKSLWDTNNGITLCEDCHIEEHKYSKGEKHGI